MQKLLQVCAEALKASQNAGAGGHGIRPEPARIAARPAIPQLGVTDRGKQRKSAAVSDICVTGPAHSWNELDMRPFSAH